MKRIGGWLLGFVVFNGVVWAVGQAVARARSSLDPTSDHVEAYTFWNSAEFVSRASSLRRVVVRVLMGGALVDLRQAIPDPDGLTVSIDTILGGTAVLVRKEWDVHVIEHTHASSVELRLDTSADVPGDRPRVTVVLRTNFGGALVGYELPERVST